MSQKTNLNVGPYYDDFDKFNNFYKVLFRPGFPVQARELTTLQSILQNQIESFARNSFSDGQKIIPGNFALNNEYFSVKINSSHLGISLSNYVDKLVGKKIKGQNSGVVAVVDSYLNISESEGITDLTLFVQYIESGNGNTNFIDGEVLTTEENFTYSNVIVNSGESVATTINDNACNIGSKFSIDAGVYFIRGSFVDVTSDFIILDAYTNTPTYRVGLSVDEEIVNAKDDPSLFDNAKGFSNFSAPGADRLKISTKLSKKSIDDTNDIAFIELVKIIDGQILTDSTSPNLIDKKLDDKLAKRTYEESGHYSVKEFEIEFKETLDDEVGNQGIYPKNSITADGNVPTDDLFSVKFSPGIAYVKGYRIENEETIITDVEKPREVAKEESSLVPLDFGTLIKVNNVSGTPKVGIGNTISVSLLDRRLTTGAIGSANTIGDARVYSFSLDGNSYEDDSSNWNLYLYDVNIYTDIVINTALSAPATSHIRGKNSNASGYLVNGVSGTTLTLTQVSGSFLVGEQLIINETEENSRTIVSVTKNGQQDVKAIFQSSATSGLDFNFAADTVLTNQQFKQLGNSTVTITTGGSVTSSLQDGFLGAKVGSVIKYNIEGQSVPTFNRVTAVGTGSSTLTVAAISSVDNVCSGSLPTGSSFSGPVSLAVGEIKSSGGLYAELPNENISTLNLKDSQLSITVQQKDITVDSNGSLSLSTPVGITSAFYKSYNAERYSFFNESNGNVSTDPGFVITGGGNGIDFNGLSFTSTQTTVNASLLKNDIISKKKIYTRSQQIGISFSKTNVGASANGLTQNNFYGLRVQDKEISLNLPDVVKIIAIYESLGDSDPTLDVLQVSTSAALNTNSIIGEKVRGNTSGSIAQIVEIDSASNAQVVLLNNKSFLVGELVSFEESNIESIVVSFNTGNYQNITEKYTLDNGSRSEYYDYSRLVRIDDSYIPNHRLKVIFDYYNVLDSDTGDVYTVNSYDAERFKNDIPDINGIIRASDTLDFRPRVAPFTSSNASPFAPSSRNFATGSNPTLVISPKEDSILGYEYYLPRIDRIVLEKNGSFTVLKGVSSLNPTEPKIVNKDDLMLLATIKLPAYLYDINDIQITLKDNKRYTMRDIGDIDNRVSTLESLTTLSLLEVDTKTLQVKDANGFDKFKSGFYVDSFSDGSKIDLQESKTKCQIDVQNKQLEAFSEITSFKPKIATIDETTDTTVNFLSDVFPDQNIVKAGNSIVLKYNEVKSDIEQLQASDAINVNPYNFLNYNGTVILTPSLDTFKDVKITKTKTVNISGAQTKTWIKQKILDTVDAVYMRSRNVKFDANHLLPFTQHYPFFDGSNNIDIVPKLLEIENTSGTFIPGATIVGTTESAGEIFRARIADADHKSGPIFKVDANNNNVYKSYSINPYDPTKTTNIPSGYSPTSAILNIDIDSLVDYAIDEFSGYVEKGMKITMIGQSITAEATVKDIRLISDVSGNVIGSFFLRKPKYIYTYTQKKNITKKQINLGFTQDKATNTVTVDDITLLKNTNKLTKKNDLQEVLVNKDKLFTTGTKTFKLTTSSSNSSDTGIYSAEAFYTSTGVIELIEQTTIKMKKHLDPVAQTFVVPSQDDIVCTSIDIWFRSKPGNFIGNSTTIDLATSGVPESSVGLTTTSIGSDGLPKITLQLVTVTGDSRPSQNLVTSDSEVILTASEVSNSINASLPTKFKFNTPVPLKAGTEYGIVLLSPSSNEYEVWIAKSGQFDVSPSSLPESENVQIGQAYLGGTFFKSSNGATWTEDQTADMKFRVNRADFVTTPGTAYFYNNLSNTSSEYQLEEDSITTLPRKISVGIVTATTLSGILAIGTKVSHGTVSTGSTNPSGIIENVGSAITTGTSYVTITNPGIGYSQGTFTSVSLYNIDVAGNGSGAQATIGVSAAGIITSVNITNGGTGYVVGDLLGITTTSVSKGKGAQITVDAVSGIDTLYLTNVQGESFTITDPLCIIDNSGSVTSLASTTITSSNVSTDERYTGNTIKVSQINHGMHGLGHVLSLIDIVPSSVPTTLISSINSTDTVLSVGNTSIFSTFEEKNSNTGYLKIGSEIMRYTSIGAGTITVTRGINPIAHSTSELVYKYELNGISLTRINSDSGNLVIHSGNGNNAGTKGIISNFTDIDEYYLKIDRSATSSFLGGSLGAIDSGTSMRSFIDENSVGGKNIKATRNLQFNAIQTNIAAVGLTSSVTIESQIRTVSGRSAGGNEEIFIDQGFENIDNNSLTQLGSVRLIASRQNEKNNTNLSSLPQSRSFTYTVTLNNGGNSKLSPFIDYSTSSVELHRNRLNKPVGNYALDLRVNVINGDPHAYMYVTQKVNLQQPATSLKVLIDAYRHNSADFRVLYQLFKVESSNNIETYELFPGFENLKDTNADGFGDLVIDITKNNGKADAFVPPSLNGEFYEYQFTADDLDKFNGFRIKIVASGTNEAYPPIFKNLKVLALA